MSKKYLPVLTLMILVLDSDACSIDNYICCLRNITFNAMVTIQNMYDMDMMSATVSVRLNNILNLFLYIGSSKVLISVYSESLT